MSWRRQSPNTPDVHHVEERLAEIVESQSALNRSTQEIKDLTAEIVRTLNSGVTNDLLVRLAPSLELIPSLLREMVPDIKSIEAQFAELHQGQQQIQYDISRLVSLITDLTARSQRGS
jgi:peptidoglycan hydrolase CwlO-like protein